MRTYTLTIAMMFAAWAAPEGSTPDVDLARLSMLSAPSGYEGSLRVVIRKSLPKGVASRVDNLGSLIIEGGKGSPHRLFVTSLDEPGLVVSRITPDGYLRLSPLGGIGPGGLDLRFFEGKRVVVRGKDGWIPGAVTAMSIHLRGKRPERFSIDDVWVDMGASSRDEAEAAGITRLAPLTLTKQFRSLAGTQVTG
ncbi:MAG: hypothetical protein O6952_07515, partial [Planctomycetota bacterium]|nr:hypothetical protein [Planctomycetota bacterium]